MPNNIFELGPQMQEPMSRRDMLVRTAEYAGGTGVMGYALYKLMNRGGTPNSTPIKTPLPTKWEGTGLPVTQCNGDVDVALYYPKASWATSKPGKAFLTDGGPTEDVYSGQGPATFKAHVGDTINPGIKYDTNGDGKYDSNDEPAWHSLKGGPTTMSPAKDCRPAPTTSTEAPTTTAEAPTTTEAATTTTEAATTTTVKVAPTTTTTAPAPTTTAPAPTTTAPAPSTTTTTTPAAPHNAPTL
jgi:hypothetical protein